MKPDRKILEDEAEYCETQLARLNAFVTELKEMASRHGTDEEVLQEDLTEAEHNISYYESELKRIRDERGGGRKPWKYAGRPQPAHDSILPRTPRQGAGALILASLGMLAGVLIGTQLASRRGGRRDD